MIVSCSYTFFGLLSSRTKSSSIKYMCVCENYGYELLILCLMMTIYLKKQHRHIAV